MVPEEWLDFWHAHGPDAHKGGKKKQPRKKTSSVKSRARAPGKKTSSVKSRARAPGKKSSSVKSRAKSAKNVRSSKKTAQAARLRV